MHKIKLIWDFRGPAADKIADHHKTHLKEFIATSDYVVHDIGTETFSELHSIAFMVIDQTDLKSIRDILKPHRGQAVTE